MDLTYKQFIDNILQTRGRFNCGEEYHERHHILPKCMGGTNDEENLIDLFAREHYIAHRLLALENPKEDGLITAWYLMCHFRNKFENRFIPNAEEYEEARKAYAEIMSKRMMGENNPMFGRTGEDNPMFGVSPSQEIRDKISKSLYGRFRGKDSPHFGTKLSNETKNKISEKAKKRLKDKTKHPMYGVSRKGEDNPFYGKKHTEEARKKISESKKGKYVGENSPLFGKKLSEETKEKISKSKKGKRRNDLKKVFCDGIIFECAKDCAEYYGKSPSTISQYLSGKKKMSKFFQEKNLKYLEVHEKCH